MKKIITTLTAGVLLAALAQPAQALTIDKPGCIYTKVGLPPIVFVECQGKLVDILDGKTNKPLKKVLLRGKKSAMLCWVMPRSKRLLCA
jgi:hypothetical protein